MSFWISVNAEISSLSSGMTWGKQSVWVTTQTRGERLSKRLVWCLSLPSWIYRLITDGKHSGKQISHYKSPQFESNHVKRRHEKVVQEIVPIHVYHFVLSSTGPFYVVHLLPCYTVPFCSEFHLSRPVVFPYKLHMSKITNFVRRTAH